LEIHGCAKSIPAQKHGKLEEHIRSRLHKESVKAITNSDGRTDGELKSIKEDRANIL
jgi:hypothetical protein